MVKKQPQAHLQLHTLYNLVMLPAQPNNNNNVEYISEIWNIAFKYNQATFIDIDGSRRFVVKTIEYWITIEMCIHIQS